MEEENNWYWYLEQNKIHPTEKVDLFHAHKACKLAILDTIESLEDCKTLHEVHQIIDNLKLLYNES